MALILPNRFYRQPTSNLIDTGNPISRGLNAGYLASTRSFFGATSPAQTSPNSTYRYDQRFGIATMGTIGATALATVFAPVSGSSDMTLLSVFFPATGVSETFPGNVGQISNAMSFGLSVGNGTTNVIRGRCYLSGTRYFGGSTTITDFNKPIVAVTRQKVGVEQALFVNGVKDPTTTAFAGATFNTVNIGVVGAGANQAQFLVGLWGRALSDTEIWELSQDPYQIFHRPNRRIWVDVPSGGGGYTMPAALGAYSLAGNAAGLKADRKILAAQSSFALTGNAAGLKADRKILAAQSSFALTGNTTLFKASRAMLAAQSSFALTGNVALFNASRKLTASLGSFALTGNDVALTYYGSNKVLNAATGVFTLTANNAVLAANRKLVAQSSSFSLSPNSAILKVTRKLAASVATYSFTGNSVGFTYGSGQLRLTASAGVFTLTGVPVVFTSGSYTRAPGGGGYSPKRINIQVRPEAKQNNNR